MMLQCVSLVAAFLLNVSAAACMRFPPSESVLAKLLMLASKQVGRPAIRGCFAYDLVLCLRRHCFLRLLLFCCTCPLLCAGAL